jgi:hypothetical protein
MEEVMTKQRMSLDARDRKMIGCKESGSLGHGPIVYRVYFTPTIGFPQRRLFITVRAHCPEDALTLFEWTASWLGAEPSNAYVTMDNNDARDPYVAAA